MVRRMHELNGNAMFASKLLFNFFIRYNQFYEITKYFVMWDSLRAYMCFFFVPS